MRAAGVPLERAGDDLVIPDWFPLQANLQVLDEIGRAFGEDALFRIGFTVREHATFPPAIRDLGSALATLDVAFHLNHRRDGAVMFDPVTGMLEGIGHYRFEDRDGETLAGHSTSVYPCSFDLGIIAGVTARFDAHAVVQHAPDGACRRRGADGCGYLVRREAAAGAAPRG